MTEKVITINTKPGIRRDGTTLDGDQYSDGQWVRFQRGRPRKTQGYSRISQQIRGLVRGMFVDSTNGINNIFTGWSGGVQVIGVDNNGVGSGVSDFTFNGQVLTLGVIVPGSGYTTGTYSNVALTGGAGTGAKATITVAGGVVTTVTLTQGGVGYAVGNSLTAAASTIGGTGAGFSIPVATIASSFSADSTNLYQFDTSYDVTGGVNLLLAHPGHNLTEIDSTADTPVLYGPINGTVLSALRDIEGTSPTGNTISVSGGVVALHPYIFVYGDAGLIKNNSAGKPLDWNSADANETNVATGKIVKGLPVRGGTNAPSGLFWSLDSLIRVSYLGGVGTPAQFWRYDIISSQSSILSSQSVIEYDGIYYWCGVDRFLMYNGVVQEIPNDMNQNYFFDNLNYAQRQKVWACKVPRYGEIWWFYPRGSATECTDAVIYNVREKTWYDAGSAPGAYRSSGYFSNVFRYPVMAGTTNYSGYIKLWQHEIGYDEVDGPNVTAIQSSFTTHDLSWVTGNPAQEVPIGDNFWTHFERVEPDFLQVGDMNLYVIGRPYAQAADVTSDAYPFSPTTTKIDMREQRREIRLKFESNTVNGNYQAGRILLSADMGDVRGYTP